MADWAGDQTEKIPNFSIKRQQSGKLTLGNNFL